MSTHQVKGCERSSEVNVEVANLFGLGANEEIATGDVIAQLEEPWEDALGSLAPSPLPYCSAWTPRWRGW